MFDVERFKGKMGEVVERFRGEMKKVRTGRAHPEMLDSVKVEVYGQFVPIRHAANVTVQDATMIVVTPFDPATLKAISAGISADVSLGLNPADDGRVVRVPIPALTEERRKEIVKTTAGKVEEAKVALRNIREDARKEVKRMRDAKELGEDAAKRAEEDIDKMIRKFGDEVEAAFKAK